MERFGKHLREFCTWGGVMAFVEIEILNWSKYNKRKELIQPRWFALNNRVLEDAQIYCLTAEEFKAWIYVLCQASQQNKSRLKLFFEHAERSSNIKPKFLASLLDKMEKAKSIQLHDRETNRAVRATTSTLQNRTIQNNTKEYIAQTNVRAIQIFDFESLYKKYPRKVGKERGLKICALQIKTQKDFDDLSLAIDRYVVHLKENATDSKFIKHFATFMGSWRDWLDETHGSSENFSKNEIDWSSFENNGGVA
jgi:hypothetical protein